MVTTLEGDPGGISGAVDSLLEQGVDGIVVTGSLISVVPLVVAFPMLQRYWRSGLSAGGVKQ